MEYEDSIGRAVGIANRIDGARRIHEVYLAGKSLPILATPHNLRRNLEEVLNDPALGYDKDVAEAAALITSVLAGEQQDEKNFTYLGQAILLKAESMRGSTNEYDFQHTVRYLLAQNGYVPVTSNKSLDFFRGPSGEEVFTLSKQGCNIWYTELKSKYYLDDFVDDFNYFTRGSSKEIEALRRQMWEPYDPLTFGKGRNPVVLPGAGFMGGFIVAGMAGAAELGFVWLYLAAGVGALLGFAGNYILNKSGDKRNQNLAVRIEDARENLPYNRISGEILALVDAFPLQENPVLENHEV